MLLVSATRPLTLKVSLSSPAFSLQTHMESPPRTVLNSASHSAQTKSDIKKHWYGFTITLQALQVRGALSPLPAKVMEIVKDLKLLEEKKIETQISYINLYGKYPPGMFANECREDKNGLDCQNVEQSKKSGGVQIAATQPSLLMLTAGLIALLL